ncbi:MAG: homoprotocatechuate degradation operon regulator HpaR [Proteobacteria bacterium]|nr:homoprotocatechuate degradation operon regulator HpaR [Pseudomonadota bacterium]
MLSERLPARTACLTMGFKPTGLHHRNLPLVLLQARERVLSYFRPILNANGITEQQWRIVRLLYEARSLEPREIVEACRISSPSMSGVLARMEELGLVKRRRLDHDQRRVRVALTPRARAMAARMAPQIEATYRRIEQQVGAQFSGRLQLALDQLLAALPEYEPGGTHAEGAPASEEDDAQVGVFDVA